MSESGSFQLRRMSPDDRDEVSRLIFHSTNRYYVSIGREPIFKGDELSPSDIFDVYERIDPATQVIHAEKLKFESNYGDEDWVRYRLRDTERLKELERALPSAITLHLSREVHKFLGDTPSLLDYVYKT